MQLNQGILIYSNLPVGYKAFEATAYTPKSTTIINKVPFLLSTIDMGYRLLQSTSKDNNYGKTRFWQLSFLSTIFDTVGQLSGELPM